MANIITIQQGEVKTLTLTFQDSDGTAIDITGATVILTVKFDLDDADSAAIMKKTQTSHSNPTAGITTISLVAADTVRAGDFFYDIVLDNTTIRKQSVGQFIINQAATKTV